MSTIVVQSLKSSKSMYCKLDGAKNVRQTKITKDNIKRKKFENLKPLRPLFFFKEKNENNSYLAKERKNSYRKLQQSRALLGKQCERWPWLLLRRASRQF